MLVLHDDDTLERRRQTHCAGRRYLQYARCVADKALSYDDTHYTVFAHVDHLGIFASENALLVTGVVVADDVTDYRQNGVPAVLRVIERRGLARHDRRTEEPRYCKDDTDIH